MLLDLLADITKRYSFAFSYQSSFVMYVVFQEYVKGISSTGMQSNCGFEGQVSACWTHKMTTKELDTIRSAGFLVSVIHGRLVEHDLENKHTSLSHKHCVPPFLMACLKIMQV